MTVISAVALLVG